MTTCYVHFDDYNFAITTDFLLYPTPNPNRPHLILGDKAYTLQDTRIYFRDNERQQRPPSSKKQRWQRRAPISMRKDYEIPNTDIDPTNDNICTDNFPSGPLRDSIIELIKQYTARVISSALNGCRLTDIGKEYSPELTKRFHGEAPADTPQHTRSPTQMGYRNASKRHNSTRIQKRAHQPTS